MGYNQDTNDALRALNGVRFGHSFKRNHEYILDALPDNTVVLDFGSGDRGSVYKLGKVEYKGKHLEIIGLDIDRENTAVKYHDLSEIDFKPDYIIVSHVLEHVPKREIKPLLKRFSEISDNLIISLPNTSNPFLDFWDSLDHEQPVDNMYLYGYVTQAGYEIVRVDRCTITQANLKLKAIFFRTLFAWLTQKSPFYNFVMICRKNDAFK